MALASPRKGPGHAGRVAVRFHADGAHLVVGDAEKGADGQLQEGLSSSSSTSSSGGRINSHPPYRESSLGSGYIPDFTGDGGCKSTSG